MTRSLSGPTPDIPYWAERSVLLGGSRSRVHGLKQLCYVEGIGVVKLRNHWSFARSVRMILRKFKRFTSKVRTMQVSFISSVPSIYCLLREDHVWRLPLATRGRLDAFLSHPHFCYPIRSSDYCPHFPGQNCHKQISCPESCPGI